MHSPVSVVPQCKPWVFVWKSAPHYGLFWNFAWPCASATSIGSGRSLRFTLRCTIKIHVILIFYYYSRFFRMLCHCVWLSVSLNRPPTIHFPNQWHGQNLLKKGHYATNPIICIMFSTSWEFCAFCALQNICGASRLPIQHLHANWCRNQFGGIWEHFVRLRGRIFRLLLPLPRRQVATGIHSLFRRSAFRHLRPS